MNAIKNVLILSITSVALPSAYAGSIHCSNAPEVVWGEYFCVYGEFKDNTGSELTAVNFGVCSGSTSAGEEEPSEVVELPIVKHSESLRASSAQWKKANAYDFSSSELGKATAYIMPKAFKKDGNSIMRLKAKLNGTQKDVKLNCVVRVTN